MAPPPLVAGKVVLITGGGSGIGAATARLCAEEGAAAVVVADRDGAAATATSTEINAGIGTAPVATAATLDVVRSADVDALVDRIVREHGRLDCAVNAAGVSGPRARIGDYTDEQWHEVVAVNLHGVFHCLRAEVRAMQVHGRGSVVNIASGAHIEPPPGLTPYAATKSAVVTMTK